MKEFMDKDFLLETEAARHLFHDYAENLPIIDYHCHISPREIYEDRRFDNLAEIWLGGENLDGSLSGDHYKWRLMRANGISEEYITGTADDRERVKKYAEALELAVGNPLYHWTNMELGRYFGETEPLTAENAYEIYDRCAQKLRTDKDLTARGLILQSRVTFVGTTDDPADSLEWHIKLREDGSFPVKVCPSFRPDKALDITKGNFPEYIKRLASAAGKTVPESAEELFKILKERLAFFVSLGCRASDHGLEYIPFREYSIDEVDAAYRKAMKGGTLTTEETEKYQTCVLLELGREYSRQDVVMQLHYSCLRNSNLRMFSKYGPDTGCDIITRNGSPDNIARLLSALDVTGECPRTIVYSLNPADNLLLDALCGAFQTDEIPGKIQHGAAWWFNDTKSGMEQQLKSLASAGILGNFTGMLTDSRSFLSYARHDYFRRILCNIIGGWVENGEYPRNEAALKRIVQGICCYNAERFFKTGESV